MPYDRGLFLDIGSFLINRFMEDAMKNALSRYIESVENSRIAFLNTIHIFQNAAFKLYCEKVGRLPVSMDKLMNWYIKQP